MPGPTNTSKLDPVDVVALGHVLTHAAHVGLPMPADVIVGVSVNSLGGPAVRFDMASLADLAEWSIYLDEPIATEPLTASVDHHSVEGQALELPIRLITTVTYSRPVLELIETQPVPYVPTCAKVVCTLADDGARALVPCNRDAEHEGLCQATYEVVPS